METEEKKICTYFLQGKCIFGNKCHNLHEYPNHPNNQIPSNHSPICRFFLKNACTRENCPFFHGYENTLQHIKTYNYTNTKEINNLIKVDDRTFILTNEQALITKFTDEDKDVKNELNQEGYKIGKMIYSGNKKIFGLTEKK